MADDIVKRLRAGEDEGVDGWWFVMAEAADEIEQLRKDIKVAIMGDSAELRDAKKEIERLREALKPFADYYKVPTFEEQRAAKAALGECDE